MQAHLSILTLILLDWKLNKNYTTGRWSKWDVFWSFLLSYIITIYVMIMMNSSDECM